MFPSRLTSHMPSPVVTAPWPATGYKLGIWRVWIAQVIGNSPIHDQAFNGVQWVCVAIYTPVQGLNVVVIRVHCVRKCSYMPKRAENELIPAEMRYQPLRAIREGVKCYLGDAVAG